MRMHIQARRWRIATSVVAWLQHTMRSARVQSIICSASSSPRTRAGDRLRMRRTSRSASARGRGRMHALCLPEDAGCRHEWSGSALTLVHAHAAEPAPPPCPTLKRRADGTKGAAAPSRWCMRMLRNQPRVSGASCPQRGRSRPRGRRQPRIGDACNYHLRLTS